MTEDTGANGFSHDELAAAGGDEAKALRRRRPITEWKKGDFNAAEKRVLKECVAGEWIVFDKDGPDDARRIDAKLIVALICADRADGAPVPHHAGLKIAGAIITGRIDARLRTVDRELGLLDCDIAGGLDVSGAQTRMINLNESELGPVDIGYVEITGQFGANGARFDGKGATALHAQGATITGGVFLDRAEFTGTCDINTAHIGGQFSANGARFDGNKAKALNAQGATITDGVFLRAIEEENGARKPTSFLGTCAINAAKIGGQFAATGARFDGTGAKALFAQGARVEEEVFLDHAEITGLCDWAAARCDQVFRAEGAQFYGAFAARYKAEIARLDLSGAIFSEAGRVGEESDVSLVLEDGRFGRLDMPRKRPAGRVLLTRAHAEHFVDHRDGWAAPCVVPKKEWDVLTAFDRRLGIVDPNAGLGPTRWALDGFTYDRLGQPDGLTDSERWLKRENGAPVESASLARRDWLKSQLIDHLTWDFRPQPFEQLAKVLRDQGYIADANRLTQWKRRYRWRSMMLHDPDNVGKGFMRRPLVTLAWRWSIFARWFYDLTSLSGTSTPRITFVTLAWLVVSALGVIGLARLGGLDYAPERVPPSGWAGEYWALAAYAADHAVFLLPIGARDDFVLTPGLWGAVAGAWLTLSGIVGTVLNAILVLTYTGYTRAE